MLPLAGAGQRVIGINQAVRIAVSGPQAFREDPFQTKVSRAEWEDSALPSFAGVACRLPDEFAFVLAFAVTMPN